MRNRSQWAPSVARPPSHLLSVSCQTCCNMSVITSALVAVIHALSSSLRFHSLAVHWVFYIATKKQVQRSNFRRMRVPRSWFSSVCPSTSAIHVRTFADTVSNMNSFLIQLKNYKTVVAAEPWKSIILQHLYEWIDVLIKEMWASDLCQRAPHVHLRTFPFVF